MIDVKVFYRILTARGVNFFTGVPDSLLKDVCAYISDNTPAKQHIIAANEGASVGLAVGNYLASGNLPLVYMQNSGIGNAVNPLLSIADDEVYSVPMLLLIGWRGEPGIKDEPQHIKQGEVTKDLLRAMQIPHTELDARSNIKDLLDSAIDTALEMKKPYALLVRKGSFGKYTPKEPPATDFALNRESAVKLIIDMLQSSDILVSTTGKTSREVFEYRKALGHSHQSDFLTVGAMGHASSIAVGVAMSKQDRNVICIDGDGSVLMHMGSLAINGTANDFNNFKHIVINNGAHDSVGGQPTVGFQVDFPKIALACGYTLTATASETEQIKQKLQAMLAHQGRAFLEIKVNKGSRADLGRPTKTPKENKVAFQEFLK